MVTTKQDVKRPDTTYVQTLYGTKAMLEFLKAEKLDQNFANKWRWWSDKRFDIGNPKNIEKFYRPDTWSFLEPMFQKFKCPVFVWGRNNALARCGLDEDRARKSEYSLITNPSLIALSFGQISSASMTFQGVYMYISGVLGAPERSTVEVSDEIKAHKAGHGGKYSFKKPPGGGRWR
jgi:hypothetical protein